MFWFQKRNHREATRVVTWAASVVYKGQALVYKAAAHVGEAGHGGETAVEHAPAGSRIARVQGLEGFLGEGLDELGSGVDGAVAVDQRLHVRWQLVHLFLLVAGIFLAD